MKANIRGRLVYALWVKQKLQAMTAQGGLAQRHPPSKRGQQVVSLFHSLADMPLGPRLAILCITAFFKGPPGPTKISPTLANEIGGF